MAKKEVNNKEVKKNDKNKKTFFKSFKTELKKVVWPTPKQLVNNTVTVITIVLICAAIVFVLDFVFETFNEQGIKRIRDVVIPQNTVEENTTTNSTENTTIDSESTESNESTEVQVNDDGSVENVEENTNPETEATTEAE